MKTILSIIAASLLLALPAYADDTHQHGEKAGPAAAAKAPAAAQPLQKMQANVRKMQAQLARIGKAKSEEARHKLLAEHLQTLQENMMLGKEMADGDSCAMMHGDAGMMGHQGMGMMEQSGGMMGKGSGMTGQGGGMAERMQQMEKRMDMMQMMMEQMGKTQPAPAK